ncbi:hypothetical protein GCM10023149_33810 [Mucilaginibacter gynuensis]|uniref:HTH araC/xylS-type domain-containing protein n=1 Tax=Mucilaginibacter gynuensis TaxID=1302236 RepID=A0ABP8GSA7_9SPHI
MLKLAKGEYSGQVSSSFAAGGLRVTLTDYRAERLCSPLHTHENAHLSYSLTGDVLVGRKRLNGLLTNSEKFSYIRAGEYHQTQMGPGTGRNINLELEPAFMQQYELKENHLETLTNTPGAGLVMLRLLRELDLQDAGSQDQVHFLTLSLLQDQQAIVTSRPPLWVNIVREFLHDNWDREISLRELSDIAGVHPVTISKHFGRYFACNLGEYRRRLKLEKALALLSDGNYSLTEVAYHCGFFDQCHFIRALKDETGFLPKRLRALTTG